MANQNTALIIVFGLPGTGKTTFAAQLSQNMGIVHFNTDMIRERLGKSGQYDIESKISIYEEMLRLTEIELKKGNIVIVDGTFYKRSLRERFEALAKKYNVSVKRIELRAAEEVVLERLAKERRYSEADHVVYQIITGEFDPIEKPALVVHSDQQDLQEMVEMAIAYIEK